MLDRLLNMPIQVGLNLCLLKSAWFPPNWKNNPASLTSIFLHILTNQPFPLREEILRQMSFCNSFIRNTNKVWWTNLHTFLSNWQETVILLTELSTCFVLNIDCRLRLRMGNGYLQRETKFKSLNHVNPRLRFI